MSDKPTWDDIPSLKLELDDGETPAGNKKDLRSTVRLSARTLIHVLMAETKNIHVQVANRGGVLKQMGILQDINQHGLCFLMSGHGLQKDEDIKIGLKLGKRPFLTNAVVRWTSNDEVGVEYINPKREDVEFLAELYAASKLSRIG